MLARSVGICPPPSRVDNLPPSIAFGAVGVKTEVILTSARCPLELTLLCLPEENIMSDTVTVARIRTAMQAPLPGLPAQMRMATRPRSSPYEFQHDGDPRLGAVLILLYPCHRLLCLPLTRRSERVAYHKGQIALPGGARDAEDDSLWDTALRETREELGIDTSQVQYIAALSELHIAGSHFLVHPFLGFIAERPEMHPSEEEVAAIIEMPLATILNPGAKAEETWLWRDRLTQVPFYRYESQSIWGATAMILSELEAVLSGIMG